MVSLGHGEHEGPRGHPGRNVEEAAEDRLAVQARSQDWEQPCQSHTVKATRTGFKQVREETRAGLQRKRVGVRLGKKLEQGARWDRMVVWAKEWQSDGCL